MIVASVIAATGGAQSAGASSPAQANSLEAQTSAFPVIERDWLPANSGPQPPADGAMAYDRARKETVLLVPGAPSRTFVFDGGSRQWSQRFPSESPELVNARAAYDDDTGTIVLFGGKENPGGCNPGVMGETWTWDGNTWTRQHPAARAQ